MVKRSKCAWCGAAVWGLPHHPRVQRLTGRAQGLQKMLWSQGGFIAVEGHWLKSAKGQARAVELPIIPSQGSHADSTDFSSNDA